MLSEQEKASVCALFDSYCHTVLRNATDVATLVNDLNALLLKLKIAGIMAKDPPGAA